MRLSCASPTNFYYSPSVYISCCVGCVGCVGCAGSEVVWWCR